VAGDAGSTSVAINLHGQAAFAFTEWQRNRVLLRVATYAGSHWRVATLDRRSEPIWSPRVVVTPNGGTVAAWIDDAAPLRRVRVAALVGNSWHEAITLDAADGLGSVAGAPGIDNRVVFAWHDSLANEERVRAIVYAGGSWSRPVTLAAGVERLGRVFVGSQAAFVRWRRDRGSARTAERVESIRHAGAWGRAWVVRLDRTKSPDRPRAAIRP
jgi:hypothetical protein